MSGFFNPTTWNWSQYKAAGKHVVSYAAGGVTVAVAFHFLSPAQGQDISQNIGLITDGATKIATGIAGLIAILAPIYNALRAANNSSPSAQITSVVQNLSAPQITQAANAVADPASRTKLIEAVADMPEVKKIVPNDPTIATSTLSPKVTLS